MRSLLAKMLGAGSRLSELESLVLSSIRDRLDSRIAALWTEQLQAVNKVQRLPDGVEVNLYRMRKGRPTFDGKMAFPNKTEELLVASVQIGLPNVPQRLKANVWCVKGFLFSIEFDGSVAYFEEAAGMDPRPEFTISCELISDLSQSELQAG